MPNAHTETKMDERKRDMEEILNGFFPFDHFIDWYCKQFQDSPRKASGIGLAEPDKTT